MKKATSAISLKSAVIAVCGVIAFGVMMVATYPAHASNPQATSTSKSSVATTRGLTPKDWKMLVKGL